VLSTVRLTRELTVLGSGAEEVSPSLGIDEWFGPQPSRIVRFEYEHNGTTTDLLSRTKKRAAGLEIETDKFSLRPGEKLIIRQEYQEVNRRCDAHHVAFAYAVRDPVVRVNADSALDWDVSFAHRAKAVRDDFRRTVSLAGTLLPNQLVSVRWWDREIEKQWRPDT
jgi:hypothetical protein